MESLLPPSKAPALSRVLTGGLRLQGLGVSEEMMLVSCNKV